MDNAALELAELDLVAQGDLIRRGEVTPLELVEAAITRIDSTDPLLNAIVARTYEDARERARLMADRSPDANGAEHRSPVAGTPFLIKDLGAQMAGVPETAGCRAQRDMRPMSDSALVRRYREAGLIILGRTNTPEFGNHSTCEPVLFGPTRNPWDPALTTGGSSGGSAAAVASRMVPAAHGGDGAGSLRIPASCCGVFGFKPTRGRVSPAPGTEKIGGLSVRHAITNSVRDSAVLLDIASGPEPGDLFPAAAPVRPFGEEVGRDPGRLRIAWTTRAPLEIPIDPECAEAVASAAQLLGEIGHQVEEAAPMFDGEVLVEPLATVWAVRNLEDAEVLEGALRRPLEPNDLEPTTWELVEFGRSRSGQQVADAFGRMANAARRIGPFFEKYDAWLTPTLGLRPQPLGVLNQSQGGAVAWWRFDFAFNPWNPIANITGQPAMSVPLHWTDDGVPIGVLVTGRYGDEGTLFRLAGQLESARPWRNRRPPIQAIPA
jgi:amidase